MWKTKSADFFVKGFWLIGVFTFIYFYLRVFASSGVCFLTQNYFLAILR